MFLKLEDLQQDFIVNLCEWDGHLSFMLSPKFSGKQIAHKNSAKCGQSGWLSGLAPPSAQGMILETRDGVPHWASCMEPASHSACVSASLSVCVSH